MKGVSREDARLLYCLWAALFVFSVFCFLSLFLVISSDKYTIESRVDSVETIKSELAYHEAYLRSLDNNATRDRKMMKQSKETIDFIYNGLGGQKWLGGE